MLILAAFLMTAAAAPAPAPPPVASLAWLPANTAGIVGAPRDDVSMLKWLRQTATLFSDKRGKPLPECWDRVTKPIVASYQVLAGLEDNDGAAVLVQGRVDRTRAEACIVETLRTLPSPLRMSRTGAITQFDADLFGSTYVGWTPAWVVWHPKRERVEELLAAIAKERAIPPVLAAAIARVDRSATLWSADTRDYSSLFTSVPNRSWTLAASRAGSNTLMRVSVEYAAADDAKRAAAALAAARADAALASELRALARDVRPTVRDRFVDLQLDGKFLTDTNTMSALQAWMEKKRAASMKP
jgi:hypothetical protein